MLSEQNSDEDGFSRRPLSLAVNRAGYTVDSENPSLAATRSPKSPPNHPHYRYSHDNLYYQHIRYHQNNRYKRNTEENHVNSIYIDVYERKQKLNEHQTSTSRDTPLLSSLNKMTRIMNVTANNALQPSHE